MFTNAKIIEVKTRSLFIGVFVIFVLFSSCTPQRRLTYIQDRQRTGDELSIHKEEYRLKPGDILHVRIMSSDPSSSEIFNFEDIRRAVTRTASVGDPGMFLYGYTIDHSGEIQMPIVGGINLAGLNIREAHEKIQVMVRDYIIDATVSVKVVNFSVTVLGEVRSPGSFYIYDHDFTVMGALGLAGDLTDYANRNIHLVRRSENGLKFHRLDITDRLAFNSELYYLQPNDLIYVEPLLAKRFGFAQFPFAVFFSAISTTLLLINFITR
jgi:polysaccharide biosynthesis/export protein